MFHSVADVESHNPERLLKRLCNHWRHRFEITSDRDGHALIQLGERGIAEFTIAKNTLHTIARHGEAERLPALQVAIANHLQRFAKDEVLKFHWHPES